MCVFISFFFLLLNVARHLGTSYMYIVCILNCLCIIISYFVSLTNFLINVFLLFFSSSTPITYEYVCVYVFVWFIKKLILLDHLQQLPGAFVPASPSVSLLPWPLPLGPVCCSFRGSLFAIARKISLTFIAVFADVSMKSNVFSSA